MPPLRLQVLGGLRLHDAAGCEIRIPSRKGRALLAWLALRPDEAHARERLATLLWEDTDEESARTSLRQAWASLRKSIPSHGRELLQSDNDTLRLVATVLDADVRTLRNALASSNRAQLQSGLALYRGELLEGFDARSSAFDEWLSAERQILNREVVAGLQRLEALCTAHSDDDGALAACLQLLNLEPLNEAAHRSVMQLHARRGSIAAALRQFRICRDALRRDLDVTPEPATEALYRDLMRRRRSTSKGSIVSDEGEANPGIDPQSPGTHRRVNQANLHDAVVMVAHFEGLLELEATLDPEEMQNTAMEIQALVHRAVQEFGGLADRRVGANVSAVFGVPTARGNEAERATRAALLLRELVKTTCMPPGIFITLGTGIAQGQVILSNDVFPLTGRPTHVAYTLAARAGSGRVLLSDELRQSLGERVTVERDFHGSDVRFPGHSAPELAPRGAPLPCAWSLLSFQENETTAGHGFVGRRPELAMILASLDRCAATRHGRAIVLRGEAGIGKTRLANALCSAARERGVTTHYAQIFDFGQSPSRRPITMIALSLLGLTADASAAERASAVAQVTQRAGSGRLDPIIFLSDLIDAPLESELAVLERAMDGATRQRGRTDALIHLLEVTSQHHPLLLIVEDIHWADDDELSRLGEIAAVVANCPVLLLMTTRPEGDPTGKVWRSRSRACPVTTIELAPLADDEAMELAATYTDLESATLIECIRRAEGVPLFLDQLLRAAKSGLEALPGSVRTLVVARAGSLSDRDRDALNAAAVLGHRFQLSALRAVTADEDFAPDGLLAAGLLRDETSELQFAHAVFRDAIYESLLKSRRRDLHLRAAGWFVERDAALHADHLAAAGDKNAAAAYRLAAGKEQRALHFERALTLAGKGRALARDPQLVSETHRLVAELQVQLGRVHEGLTTWREALELAPDAVSRGIASLGIASALRIMDRHSEALDTLDCAEAALTGHKDPALQAQLYRLRGNLCFPLGRIEACLRAHQKALEHARQACSPAETARAYGGIGDAWYQRGRMLTAREMFAQCIDEARRHGLSDVLIANLPMLGITHMYSGDMLAARQYLAESLELVRRIGDLRGELLVQLIMASGLNMQGQEVAARSRAQRALELAQRLHARRFQAEALGVLAATRLARGPDVDALELVSNGIQIARATGMNYCGPALLGIAARASADPAHRAALLDEGEALLRDDCVSHSYFEFYQSAIEVSLLQRAPDAVRRYANALKQYTTSEPTPWTESIVRRANALADSIDDPAQAHVIQEIRSVRADCQRMELHAMTRLLDEALNPTTQAVPTI